MLSKTLVAIIAIAAVEIVALLQGIDGQYLSVVIAVIAGLGGYAYAKKE